MLYMPFTEFGPMRLTGICMHLRENLGWVKQGPSQCDTTPLLQTNTAPGSILTAAVRPRMLPDTRRRSQAKMRLAAVNGSCDR